MMMLSKFKARSYEPELMDDLNSSGGVIDQTLRELEVINKWLGGNHVTLNGLEKLLAPMAFLPEQFTLVDIGCGGGDMLKLIAHWGRKRGFKMNLIGIDANPNIIEIARRNSADFPEISYRAINIFSEDFASMKFDIVVSTLFMHHFHERDITCLFKRLRHQTRLGMVINDLHRHWFAYHSIKMLTAAFSKSEMVRHDAAVSVLRAFHKKELEDILRNAAIFQYSISWKWAFRWQIVARF